jgi:hypothetical protein
MGRRKKPRGPNAFLEEAIQELLKETMKNPKASRADKCAVIDRALKMAAINNKVNAGDGFGEGFSDPSQDPD